MSVLQFTTEQSPAFGGLFTTPQAFKEILSKSQIVETISHSSSHETFGDHQIRMNDTSILKGYPIPINHKSVLKTIRAESISLVIIHGLWRSHAVIGYEFAKQHNIPYWFIPHGGLDPYVFSYRSKRKNIWLSLIGNEIIRNASAVICASDREYEKASHHLANANVEVCHWGIEVPDLDDVSKWRTEIRDKLGIAEDKRVLLYLGRLHPMKSPIETALAFKRMNLPDWCLLMVGPLSSDIQESDIQNIFNNRSMYYIPPVSGIDKWKMLAAADAFVNFSHRENFGNSVAEASAIGLPLIISDGVDIAPFFQNAGAADILSVKSFHDIPIALESFLCKTPAEHHQMGVNAHECFHKNFTYARFKENLISLCQQYSK